MNDNLGLDFVAFCKSRGINLATDRDYLAFVDVWWVRVFIVFFEKKDSIPTQYVDSGLLSRLCIHLSERLVHCRVNVEEYKTWGVIYQVLKGADVSLFEFERQVAANPVSYSVVCDMVKDFKFCVFYTRSEIPEEEFDCAPVAV